jgi:hypothetical protein
VYTLEAAYQHLLAADWSVVAVVVVVAAAAAAVVVAVVAAVDRVEWGTGWGD